MACQHYETYQQSVTAMKRNSLHLCLLNWTLNRQTAYSEDDKAELERIKIKLSDFQTEKTRGAVIRSRARWYEHGEKNSKYFLNLEKLNYRRKHISSLINHNGTRIQQIFLMKGGTSLKNCTPLGMWTLIVRSSVIFLI